MLFAIPDLWSYLVDVYRLQGTPLYLLTGALVLLSALIPYLLGSINPAVLISRIVYHQDIRNFGSGNAGTTNMLRTYGKGAAGATFGLDLAKAALSVVVGQLLYGVDGCAIAGFFVIFGHMFPIFEKFKGGKGVACLSMVILLTSPPTFLILLLFFAVMVIGTRMVSFASIFSAMLYPLILRAFFPKNAYTGLLLAFATVSAIFVIFMHRGNMKRIMEGKESKLDFSKLFGKKKKNLPTSEDTESKNGEEKDAKK